MWADVVDTFVVNAFVVPGKSHSSGNPAGVVVVPPDVPFWQVHTTMQDVAHEMSFSETAFVQLVTEQYDKHNDDDNDETVHYLIRWFTPKVEVDLCGHATLAPAAVLMELHAPTVKVCFHSKHHGKLLVRTQVSPALRDGQEDTSALADDTCFWLEFPISHLTKYIGSSQELCEALRIQPEHVVSVMTTDYDTLVHVDCSSRLLDMHVDQEALGSIHTRGIIVTSHVDGEQLDKRVQSVKEQAGVPKLDFLSRFFAPRCGIDEDPVTGSAHCALFPYWQSVLGGETAELIGAQMSSRAGIIFMRRSEVASRLRIGGHAFVAISGRTNIPHWT